MCDKAWRGGEYRTLKPLAVRYPSKLPRIVDGSQIRTMSDDSDQRDEEPNGRREPLEYRDRGSDLAEYDPWMQFALGAILSAITIFALVAACMLVNLDSTLAGSPFEWKLPSLITGATIAGWAVLLYANRSRHRFALGAAAGVAGALLIEGFCFAANR
jgi:hypothetical protein